MADQPWNFFSGAISGDSSPDYFLPDVFTLSSGTVQGIETSPTDPKVRIDSTGLFATDAAGNKILQLNADGTGTLVGHLAGRGLDMTGATGVNAATSDNKVTWHHDTVTGARIAEVFGYGQHTPGNQFGAARLEAYSPANKFAFLDVSANDSADNTLTGVFVNVAGTLYTLVDATGWSDFSPQLVLPVNDAAGPWNGTNGTVNWTAPKTGKALLGYFVSAWAGGVGDSYIDCYFNNGYFGSAHMYANNAAVHMFYSPRFILTNVVKGTAYQIRVGQGANSNSGTDDRLTVAGVVM